MFVARSPAVSLRLERSEYSRLLWAFVISLALHLLVWGTYKAGDHFGWWRHLRVPAWMQQARLLNELFKRKPAEPPRPESEQVPLVFVEVAPSQATVEPPKDTPYYSSQNSQAANPEETPETGAPKITGTQTEVPKVEEVKKPEFVPLQPSPPAPVAKVEQPEEAKPKPVEKPGDLTMARPEETPRPDPGETPRPRPRTIKEARARQQPESRIPGEKMEQDRGTKRRSIVPSFDAKATPFGAYDAALIESISQHWYSLLDERDYASDSRGKVVLQFVLHHDGRVTGLDVTFNSAGEVLALICQKAVREPAPYPAWPADMRRLMGDSRNIQFTFYYN